MTDSIELWCSVYLIGASETQQQNITYTLQKNGCEVLAYDSVDEISVDPNNAPHAILTKNINVHTIKKNPYIEFLLSNDIPLVALKEVLHSSRAESRLSLNDGKEISYTEVRQMASSEILKVLCEKYDKNYGELPIAQRGR